MAILTIARGNAKTALASVIALAHLIGVYDTQPRREVLLAALTRDQAKIAWQFVLGFSESLPIEVQEQLTIRRGSKLEIEFSGKGGGIVKALAAEGKSNLGSAPTLVVLDESSSRPLGSGLKPKAVNWNNLCFLGWENERAAL